MAADLRNQLPLFSGRSIYFTTFCHLSMFQLDNYAAIVLPAQRKDLVHTLPPSRLPCPTLPPTSITPETPHTLHISSTPPQHFDPKTSYNQPDSAGTNTSRILHTFSRHSWSSSSLLSSPGPPSFSLFCLTHQQKHIHTDTQTTKSKYLAMSRIFNN